VAVISCRKWGEVFLSVEPSLKEGAGIHARGVPTLWALQKNQIASVPVPFTRASSPYVKGNG